MRPKPAAPLMLRGWLFRQLTNTPRQGNAGGSKYWNEVTSIGAPTRNWRAERDWDRCDYIADKSHLSRLPVRSSVPGQDTSERDHLRLDLRSGFLMPVTSRRSSA